MKKFLFRGFQTMTIMFLLVLGVSCYAQTPAVTMSKQEVAQWFKKGEWLNGCQLKPHQSTNQEAFAKEYTGNKAFWDKAFVWLKTNDLNAIVPGRYVIDEGNVIATVSEAPAPELANVKWEIHKNFNDLQYIIKGKARMAAVPVAKATETEAYDPKRDAGFYNAEGELYIAEPGTFFIFTPADVHRPGIKADGFDGPVKKVVIKIKAAGAK